MEGEEKEVNMEEGGGGGREEGGGEKEYAEAETHCCT